MKLEKWELWENLTLSNDFIFSKVMRDKELCKETLEILLDKKVGEITYIDNQKVMDINYDSKSIRLDVYVEDEQRYYDIEMQVVHKKDLAKRSRYYQGIIDLNAIEKGQTYDELKESIVIFICKFDPFNKGLSRYTFKNTCKEDKELYLEDGTSRIFFNTKDYDKEKKEDTKSLLEYIEKDETNKNVFVNKIEEKIKNIKENKEWRTEYMTFFMREREIAKENYEKGKMEERENSIKQLNQERENSIKQLKEERENSIKKMIELCREFNLKEENIIEKVISKYNLSEEEVKKYLK